MDSNINASGDSVHAVPASPADKLRKTKNKTGKAVNAAATKVKIEADSFVRAGREDNVQNEKGKPSGTEAAKACDITAEDVLAFVRAYNKLLGTPGEDFTDVRVEVYKPVRLDGQSGNISLYEIGVAHSPNHWSEGALSVNKDKLSTALKNRSADICALFFKEGEGLLHRLCSLVIDKKSAFPFLRECARIIDGRKNG